ncbi:GGDEF domain-containing protein [Streptomyces violascens]|uniref:GGDEF domain-containing protein n=1 Tax=Streptomyces violascens TaxID=67381 RepID=UPI003699FFCE
MTNLLALVALPLLGWLSHTLWLSKQLHAARRDPLTRLPARDAFTSRAHRAIRRPHASVLVLDVDRFKEINDTYGHAAGDAVLAAVGGRLGTWCRARGGFAGRLGGDEFAAVVDLGPLPDHDAVRALNDALTEPVAIGATALHPRVSVGICGPDTRPGAPLPVRLRTADEAMYAAKTLGTRWRYAGAHSTHPTIAGRRAGRPGTHTSLTAL